MMSVLAGLVVAYIRLVYKSNRLVEFDEQRADRLLAEHAPVIVTCWHGQHFIAPMFTRGGEPSVAMVSRSKDAELNARVVEKLGFETVRASGGRASARMANKGAVRGILALREKLRAGHSVFMMADIPHGTPREAGLGIVSLASKQVGLLVDEAATHFDADALVVYSGNNEFLEVHAQKYADAHATPISRARELLAE